MKIQSTIKPEPFVIKRNGEEAEITLLDKIVSIDETTDEEGNKSTLYNYIVHKVNTLYRENLQQDINDNFAEWLEKATKAESEDKASAIRAERNIRLAETDAEATVDRLILKFNITKLEDLLTLPIIKYRQALRDITKQKGFPETVVWPLKPTEV